MDEEEKTARQQVLSIINSNAKNNALKLLRRYTDPYECWTGLKTRYESDSGPRRVMLIEKLFSLRKTESMSMDTHLIAVKEIANLLEEVEVIIPEDIIVYYTLKNLPKEYEIFRRMQIVAQTLPTYEQLEAKLISEETAIRMENQQQEEGEALFLHRNPGRRTQQSTIFGHYNTQTYGRPHRRQVDFGGPSVPRFSGSATQEGFTPRPPNQNASPEQTQRGMNNVGTYQPRFRTRGSERPRNNHCNFCGMDGHFERECDLRSILDRIKDYEHRLLERRNKNLSGQVHNIEEPAEDLLADQVVDACLVELNMLEVPQSSSSWYLDSGATHHVSGDPNVFSSISPTSESQIRSAGGQSHDVIGIGNVDIQGLSGEIKPFFFSCIHWV